ncbi:MAG: N-formylglutamate deformylase [Lysobacter sp.]|nr:N-formylglutamate deformylase [Lysobacter sp.]
MNPASMDSMDTDVYTLHRGTIPLLVSVPHDGTAVPDGIAARLTDSARRVPDTDWHIARLYAFARDLGASMIVPKYSRYVVDLNRSEDDVSLYPGQNTTGLCPTVQFNGEPIYREGEQPASGEIAQRVERYWRPYHGALRDELDRLRSEHGRVLLWEGHSIKGELPFLFDGRLPDLNLGTANGTSCSPELQSRIETALAVQGSYDYVVNGRFKGGYVTRNYGDPANGIDAVQLEVSQRVYMDEEGFRYDEAKAAPTWLVIKTLLEQASVP